MKRFILITMLVIAVSTLGWAQQYLDDYDGRNWVAYTKMEKNLILRGMFLHSIFVNDVLAWADEKGYDVHATIGAVLRTGSDPDGLGTLDVANLIDAYYSKPENVTTPLYQAFFDVLHEKVDKTDTSGDNL